MFVCHPLVSALWAVVCWGFTRQTGLQEVNTRMRKGQHFMLGSHLLETLIFWSLKPNNSKCEKLSLWDLFWPGNINGQEGLKVTYFFLVRMLTQLGRGLHWAILTPTCSSRFHLLRSHCNTHPNQSGTRLVPELGKVWPQQNSDAKVQNQETGGGGLSHQPSSLELECSVVEVRHMSSGIGSVQCSCQGTDSLLWF